MEKKYESKISEYKILIEGKDKNIEDLISKNQNLLTENKIVKEKNKLLDNTIASLKELNEKSPATNAVDESKQKL